VFAENRLLLQTPGLTEPNLLNTDANKKNRANDDHSPCLVMLREEV
jgi:hypothetical protein